MGLFVRWEVISECHFQPIRSRIDFVEKHFDEEGRENRQSPNSNTPLILCLQPTFISESRVRL